MKNLHYLSLVIAEFTHEEMDFEVCKTIESKKKQHYFFFLNCVCRVGEMAQWLKHLAVSMKTGISILRTQRLGLLVLEDGDRGASKEAG